MASPNKLQNSISKVLTHYLQSEYRLTPSSEKIDNISRHIIWMFNEKINSTRNIGNTPIKRLVALWFKTTNIRGNIEEHSVWGFASFMDKNFNIIIFNRKKILHKIIFKLMKLIF